MLFQLRKSIAIACAVLVALLGMQSAANTQAQTDTGTLEYEGLTRTYALHAPPNAESIDSLGLVIGLHPFASSGRALATMTDLNAAADRDGFIAVYPDGVEGYWNDSRAETGRETIHALDDTGFVLALIDDLTATYDIDPERVYLTGIDNGGALAFHLACVAPDTFDAVAVVSTLMWNYLPLTCPEDTGATDLLILTGTGNPFYPPNGREVDSSSQFPLATLNVDQSMGFWLARAECEDTTVAQPDADNDRIAVVYGICPEGQQVAVAAVRDASHGWLRAGGDYALNQFGIDATDAVTWFFAGNRDWEDLPLARITSDYEGAARSYRYYVPSSYDVDDPEPTPLVVALHGRPGTGSDMAYITGMNSTAESNGFIVVYPDGLRQEWNYVRGLQMFGQAFQDDSEFMRLLVDDLAIDLNIDRERVYVTGFSNGGFMTQRLACETSDLFAAYAVVGATAFPGMYGICDANAVEGIPIMFIHGTLDISVPWEGQMQDTGAGGAVPISLSVAETIGFWVDLNACSTVADFEEIPQSGDSPGTRVIFNRFGDCENDNPPVEFYLVEGGGHNWPGRPGIIGDEIAGMVNVDINASDVIWDFFAQYTLGE